MQTNCHQVRPECRFHVSHGFARIQTWDRVSISSENHDERTVPKVHLLHQSLLSQHHPTVLQSDTSVFVPHSTRLCLSASASKPDFLSFRPRQEDEERAGASWTPRQSTTRAAGICLASDCQFRKSSCPNRTNVCRLLRHRRLPLLESLLQIKILPPRMPGYQRHV